MYDMVDNVMSIPENGSAEKAYLAELIAISNANIEIAKQYLSNNSYNLALNSLANNIIQTQSDEVKYMNQLYNDVYIIDIEKELKYLNSFNNAMCTNTTSVLYKSIDIAFASAIKENYKIILDLSNNIISCNCSDNIRYFAQDLINKHDGTINHIEQILNA